MNWNIAPKTRGPLLWPWPKKSRSGRSTRNRRKREIETAFWARLFGQRLEETRLKDGEKVKKPGKWTMWSLLWLLATVGPLRGPPLPLLPQTTLFWDYPPLSRGCDEFHRPRRRQDQGRAIPDSAVNWANFLFGHMYMLVTFSHVQK